MRTIVLAMTVGLAAGPAGAQLLRGGASPFPALTGPITAPLSPLAGRDSPQALLAPRVVGDPLGLQGFIAEAVIPDARTLLEQRRARLHDLVRRNPGGLEADPQGNPVRRGEILAPALSAQEAAAVQAAGFTVLRDQAIGQDGLHAIVLAPPRGVPLRRALEILRAKAPGVAFDYNPVFEPAGGSLSPDAAAAGSGRAGDGAGAVIGLVDGGVGAHPALDHARIEQRGFAGPVVATGHGTAIASLLVGAAPGFNGAAQGASLLAADVYGGQPANGSAEAIARAIGWLEERHARVITISLVGPANSVMQRAIDGARAHGVLVVAAVGNDGPAAPPLYPASYDGVIAVTGVDARGRALIEAGRPRHLDFAAPGADMAAALQGGGFAAVRGTSFAAPLAAARLAAHPEGALAAVTAEARPGHGGNVGRGVVCARCAADPRRLARENTP